MIGTEWNEAVQKPRVTTIKNLLAARGETIDALYLDVSDDNGKYMRILIMFA